ncbi:LOW QUALITY PROTEIN: hypothetical protein CRUP_033282 [Coryphaenoides rupestris]|nr:LOW QUALITY PROTEIN: hypothetical protein CRUP_033282 [Coryphaenoides rupestris]
MAGCMLYVMWKNVGRCTDPAHGPHPPVNLKLTLSAVYRGGVVVGPALGLLVLLVGVCVFVVYQVWVSQPGHHRLTAFLLFYGYHLAAQEGGHNPTRSLDVALLVGAALGQLSLSYFSLVAALEVGAPGPLGGLDLSYSLLSLLELMLQNIFIIEGLNRHPKDSKNATWKRATQEICAFLIFSNVMLWIIPAFGAHPQFENGVGKEFFGFTTWFVLVNLGQPLGVFYRMHSDGVGHGEQAYQSAVLEELQDLRLVVGLVVLVDVVLVVVVVLEEEEEEEEEEEAQGGGGCGGGSVGAAGLEPSIGEVAREAARAAAAAGGLFFRLCRALWMEAVSVGQLVEDAPFADDGVHQVEVTCQGPDDRKDERGWSYGYDLKQEEDQVVVLDGGEEEPGGGEGLQQVEQFVGRHHGQALQIFQKRMRSSWWKLIFLVEWGRSGVGGEVTTTTTTTYFVVLGGVGRAGALQGVQGGGGGSAGGRGDLVLQRHHQDLHGHLHKPLPLVREQQAEGARYMASEKQVSSSFSSSVLTAKPNETNQTKERRGNRTDGGTDGRTAGDGRTDGLTGPSFLWLLTVKLGQKSRNVLAATPRVGSHRGNGSHPTIFTRLLFRDRHVGPLPIQGGATTGNPEDMPESFKRGKGGLPECPEISKDLSYPY